MLPKILTLQFQRSCIFIQLHSFSAFRVFQATWQCGGPPSGLEWDFTFLCEIHFLLWRICGDQLYPTLSCHQLVEWKASRSFLLLLLFLLILAHQSVRSVSPPGETFFIIFPRPAATAARHQSTRAMSGAPALQVTVQTEPKVTKWMWSADVSRLFQTWSTDLDRDQAWAVVKGFKRDGRLCTASAVATKMCFPTLLAASDSLFCNS